MPGISSDNAMKVERLLLKNIRKLTKKKIGQIYETVVIALLFFFYCLCNLHKENSCSLDGR